MKLRRGNSAIEFALILPVFMTLVIGMFEMSWMFFQRASVIAATREGCRAASVISDEDYQKLYAIDKITENLLRYGIDCGNTHNCTIPDPTITGLTPYQTLRCQTSVQYRSLTRFIPVPAEMLAVSEVRREGQ